METPAEATAFVTSPAGFLGAALMRLLVALGQHVFGLADSPEAAAAVRRAGGTPVMGDLLTPGRWQDEAVADWVFRLPHPADRPGTRRRAAWTARARGLMDANLINAAGGSTRRIVYVADIRCYGATGSRPVTEDESPRGSASGARLCPTLDRLEGYFLAGLPIVTAFPGLIYGNGSWFRDLVMEPLASGRRVLQVGTKGPLVSPIHVRDCALALAHLAGRGERGGRYFLVNSQPARFNEFATTFARIANRPLRVWRLPAAAARLVGGRTVAGHLHTDAVFSNSRLRGTGFRFAYPTLEDGLHQILEGSRWTEQQ
jgi:nucleoside-diphosphate-sugar epimerase